MAQKKYHIIIGNQKGFVLVTAIIASMILFAVGILALTLSSQDVRISAVVVGDKKAFSACESGLHNLTVTFDPSNRSASAVSDRPVDSTTDPGTVYSVVTPTRPTSPPEIVPLPGYSIGGGQTWGQTRYNTTITGANTRYDKSVQITVGLGYGPVEMSTMAR